MSKPWAKIGAWAADVEAEEAEEQAAAAAASSAAAAAGPSFPSLKEAISTKQPKKKKMSLQEFTMQQQQASTNRRDLTAGLTPAEMLRLPTGPKERSAEEMDYRRLGGGFSNYGRDRDGGGDRDSTRRSYGGFHDDRGAQPSRVSDFDQPSRADEVDNWALEKKTLPSLDSGRSSRYSSLGGGGGGLSRADEVDSWAAGKKPVVPVRSSNFGSSSRDSGREPDRWVRGVGFGEGDLGRERPKLVLDPPRRDGGGVVEVVRTNRPSPFGNARPREEVLTEKGLDWKKLDLEMEGRKSSRPTSSQSSRPSSSQSNRSESLGLSRPKVNPFGDAKPREVLLEQKGMDWRKIDLELEHRGVDRPETEAEKNLKEEIDHLKKVLENECVSNPNRESVEGSPDDQSSLRDTIHNKERELELLIRELDDKVRFGQKATERPGSGSGRVFTFPERRPPSQSGVFEDSRRMDVMERPRSRGTGDMWTRQGDDRRGYQGGRERGFLGNRGMDRSRSRERW